MVDYYDGVRILKNKKTKMPIGIEWKLSNGTFVKYYPEDLSAEWFKEFCDSVREEKNMRDRIYRNCCYLDPEELDWKVFREESDASNTIDFYDECDLIKRFEDGLTMKEKAVFFIKMQNPKSTVREIASKLKVSKSCVHYQLELLRQKYLDIVKERI